MRTSPGRAPTFFQMSLWMDDTGDGVAKFEFIVANRMAADDRAICFRHFRKAAAQNLFESFGSACGGKCDDGERGNRPAAHGVDVAERVGGGNLAEQIGIVHDRREKIDGLYDGEIVGEAIDGGVVTGFKADEDIRIGLRRKAFENGVENAGA